MLLVPSINCETAVPLNTTGCSQRLESTGNHCSGGDSFYEERDKDKRGGHLSFRGPHTCELDRADPYVSERAWHAQETATLCSSSIVGQKQ